MTSLPVRRVATCILALWLVAFAAWAGPVSADPSDSVPISINIMSVGERQISWANEPITFLVEGQSPTLNATVPSVVATATFMLSVADSLPDEDRTGYRIAISASTFTAESVSTVITPSMLSIVSVSGLPAGYPEPVITGATLNSQVTILTVDDGAAAVNTTISITIAMSLTPGLMEGLYSGSIVSTILPLSSDTP